MFLLHEGDSSKAVTERTQRKREATTLLMLRQGEPTEGETLSCSLNWSDERVMLMNRNTGTVMLKH